MRPRKRTLLLRSSFLVAAFAAASAFAAEPEVPKPGPHGTLLILAPREFHPALTKYAEYKSQRTTTELIDLEDVLAKSAGVDDPERLKRFLYDRWHGAKDADSRPRYVLLVGDADVMPVRYMVLDRCTEPAFNYAFYPSDLYYADIAKPDGSFEDWNGSKGMPGGPEAFHAGYFGEVRGEKNKSDPINFDHIDYRPELAVGRWPVSTPAQVEIVADKSIAYEKSASDPDNTRARRAAFVAIGGWVDNRPLFDSLAARLPSRWAAEKRYYTDKGQQPDSKEPGAAGGAEPAPGPDEAHVVALMNEGVGLVLHSGHGSDDWWGGSIGTPSIKKLHNADRLPILLSAGCSTARFATLPPYEAYVDINGVEHAGTNNGEVFKEPPPPPASYQKGKYNLTGLGEQMLRAGPNGAAAYIGCNTGSQPCGITLLEGFVEELSQNRHPRLGDCWAAAVSFYYDHQRLADLKPNDDWYPPSIFFQGMKFMLFGDPSLRMPEPAP